MGDVAMLVPVLSYLEVEYPSIAITLLTKPQFAPIFKSFLNIKIIEADVKGKHKGISGLYRLFKQLKQLGITSVADVHNVLRSSILKFFFKSSKIPFVQIDKGRKEKKALTRIKNKDFKQLKTTHERYADVFRKLGLKIDLSKVKQLAKSEFTSSIKAIIGEKKKKWIGIAPFAAHEGKMYPIPLMEQVIQQLEEKGEYTVLLFGGGVSEIEKLHTIVQQTSIELIVVAGKLSFEQELEVISNLDVMLSMDSGNGHLAANYNVPVVSLWGVTHPYAGFAPFAQPIENAILSDRFTYPLIPTSIYGNKYPEGYGKVMDSILPERVVQKIIETLR